VNHWMNKFVLMCEYFRIGCETDPERKPSPNSRFLLTFLNTKEGTEFGLQLYSLLSQ